VQDVVESNSLSSSLQELSAVVVCGDFDTHPQRITRTVLQAITATVAGQTNISANGRSSKLQTRTKAVIACDCGHAVASHEEAGGSPRPSRVTKYNCCCNSVSAYCHRHGTWDSPALGGSTADTVAMLFNAFVRVCQFLERPLAEMLWSGRRPWQLLLAVLSVLSLCGWYRKSPQTTTADNSCNDEDKLFDSTNVCTYSSVTLRD